MKSCRQCNPENISREVGVAFFFVCFFLQLVLTLDLNLEHFFTNVHHTCTYYDYLVPPTSRGYFFKELSLWVLFVSPHLFRVSRPAINNMSECLCVCVVTIFSRLGTNRLCLSILLVVS